MGDSEITIHNACTKNRAEELGYDVWEHFVIPLFFERLDLKQARKPRVIIGGRGCGKTMLLRYLSHYSMFSQSRQVIPEEDASHIGLYWKTDTQFANTMVGRGIPPETWEAAFQHSLALTVAEEIVASLESVAQSACPALSEDDLLALDCSGLAAFNPVLKGGVDALRMVIRENRRALQMWVNNPRKLAEPLFLPGRLFLLALIEEIKRQTTGLANATFFVYLDEYENLREYQKRIINTCLKHSEAPLIFNVGMKRNAMRVRGTLGEESITDIADYRVHDLDAYLNDHDFGLFAAEILFLRLSLAGVAVPVKVDELRDVGSLQRRRSPDYGSSVLRVARGMFPGQSASEIARVAFGDRWLADKLKKEVQFALRKRGSRLPSDSFLNPELPEASIVTASLLHRKGNAPDVILAELKSLAAGQANRFTGMTGWIHNNLVGCLLRLYAPYHRTCPFYAGFETFIDLASGNIRHFLELCHKSLRKAPLAERCDLIAVGVSEQAEAAREASAAFLGEVRSFGPSGNRLHSFVLTLGSLFALAHRRPAQSEPEVSHFGIASGRESLSDDDHRFLCEALRWSVLEEEPETKAKDPLQPPSSDWVLNPIYAPYFHITYRKKRKLGLHTRDVIVLIRGTYDERRDLLKKFMREWSLDTEEVEPSLFSHLEEFDENATRDGKQ
jgi:hypothetical protein